MMPYRKARCKRRVAWTLLLLAFLSAGFAIANTLNINGNITQGDNGTISVGDNIYYITVSGEYSAQKISDVAGPQTEFVKEVNVQGEIRGWDGSSYQYVLFGSFDYQDGFAEPILWRVLYSDHNKALLLSEYVLDTRPFDSLGPYWENSDIKNWLNNEFFLSAFTTSNQRECLLSSAERGTVFLLHKGDYTNTAYGFSADTSVNDANRIASGSIYAMNHNLWTSEQNYCSYYTRTETGGTSLWQVRANGTMGVARYDRDNVGIRPAVWIDLEKIQFNIGDGTREFPFQQAQPSS
ncbi:MAG: DUF6273 domain-containing protein [Candidatus Limiplasma sp.]|nr:DUF6273 domain-containing protein [Candidatus Limiplasma sp.]